MKINQAGLDLIKQAESLQLKAYRCPAGILTIGYGHTGADVHSGLVIIKDQAEQLLKQDVEEFEEGVSHLVDEKKTTDNQFSAMVSLAFNIGLGNFKKSSVLSFHKQCKPSSAAESFNMWNKGGGRVLEGLVKRRKSESKLYLTE